MVPRIKHSLLEPPNRFQNQKYYDGRPNDLHRNPNPRSISGCMFFFGGGDLEKDYMLWPYDILKDLGLQSRLPFFIKHFLEDQTFQTQINNPFSLPKPQEKGITQDSILSVILFIIEIKITTFLFPDQYMSIMSSFFTAPKI